MSDRVVIVVTSGPRSGERFDAEGELLIGRDQAPITLDDDRVSRRHAVICAAATGVTIEDLGSTNGTWLNGRRLDRGAVTPLAPGDEIRIGRTILAVTAAAQHTVIAAQGGPEETRAAAPFAAPPPPAPVAPPLPPPVPPALPAFAEPATTLAPGGGTRRGIATRDVRVEALTIGAVLGTAIALILYFALR